MLHTCYTRIEYSCQGVKCNLYGERLKLLRKEKKVPQKELADLLGISIRGYQFYESEVNEPNVKVLTALADFYGVTIDYLVGRTNKR